MPFAFTDHTPKTTSPEAVRRLRRALVGAMLAVGLAGATFAQDEALGSKKQVVVLYSYRTLMPINADWDRGIRRALAKELAEVVDDPVRSRCELGNAVKTRLPKSSSVG